MGSGHSHSNRAKLPRHQTRDPRPPSWAPREEIVADVVRRVERERRLARRRAEVAAGPQPVVVVLPTASGRRGEPGYSGNRTFSRRPSRFVLDAIARRAVAELAARITGSR